MIEVVLVIENKQGHVRFNKRNITQPTLEKLTNKIGIWENGYRLKEIIRN